MAAGAIKAGQAFIEFTAKDKKLRESMKRIKTAMMGVVKVATAVAAIVTAAFTSVTAAAAFAASSFSKFGDEFAKAAKRLGIGADTLSELEFAAARSGASLADLESGFRRMFNVVGDLGDGTSTAVRQFGKLKLTFDDLKDLAPEDQFRLISQRLRQLSSGSRRDVIQDIFGRAGLRLLPMIEDDIDKLIARARELGITLSREDAAAAEEFEDSILDLSRSFRALRLQVGAFVGKVLTPFFDKLASGIGVINRWIADTRRAIDMFAQGFAMALNVAMPQFFNFIKALGRAWHQFGAALASSFDAAISSVVRRVWEALRDMVNMLNKLTPILTRVGQLRMAALIVGTQTAIEQAGAQSSEQAVAARAAARALGAEQSSKDFNREIDKFSLAFETARMALARFFFGLRQEQEEVVQDAAERIRPGGSSLPAQFSAAAAAIQGRNLREGDYLKDIRYYTKQTAQNTKKGGIPVK